MEHLKEAKRSLDIARKMMEESDLPFAFSEIQCHIAYSRACSEYVIGKVLADLNGEEPPYPPKKEGK